MSRCFPYPPPGYCKNGATTHEALIESIKLQKETVKPVKDKSERKKEKREKKVRKEKKREEKEKRKAEEKQAIQKNPNEFQLKLKDACFEKSESKTVTEPRTEHLEKSDLTEEHGQPTTSQKPSYSSDSTQNSNKRKRDNISIPDGSSGLGRPFKIRLLKKHKPDFDKDVLCTSSGRSDTTCLAGPDARLNLLSSSRTAGVPVTSGRENNGVHGASSSQTRSTPSSERLATKSNDLQGFQFSSKQSAPSSSARLPLNRLKHDMPSFNSNKTEAPVPSGSNKSDVEVLPSARQQPVSGYVKLLQTLNQKGVSSLDINKAKSIAAGKRPICEITVPDNSFPTRSVKRKEDQISEISKNILPGSSAPTRVEGKREDSISAIPKSVVPDNIFSTRNEKKKDDSISEIPQKASLSRHEKKLQKKFSKYEKVIGSWVPPVFEALQLPADDEDWLSRRGPKVTKDKVETSLELQQSSLWQPCALPYTIPLRFLVEADIYALPYTIPF